MGKLHLVVVVVAVQGRPASLFLVHFPCWLKSREKDSKLNFKNFPFPDAVSLGFELDYIVVDVAGPLSRTTVQLLRSSLYSTRISLTPLTNLEGWVVI